MKKIIPIILFGLGLTMSPFAANAVDKETVRSAVEKVMIQGKLDTRDGEGYDVFLKKKEKIGEDIERYTYLTVNYVIFAFPDGIKKIPKRITLTIDDWKKIKSETNKDMDGYMLTQKIIVDGYPHAPLDGKIDTALDVKRTQDNLGIILSSESKRIDLTDMKALEKKQALFDKNIEYFLNN